MGCEVLVFDRAKSTYNNVESDEVTLDGATYVVLYEDSHGSPYQISPLFNSSTKVKEFMQPLLSARKTYGTNERDPTQEELQALLARTLAGEIKSPKGLSLADLIQKQIKETNT